MDIYLKTRTGLINATATFEPDTGIVVVKAGSLVSKDLSNTPTFRSRKAMLKRREGVVINGVLQKDVEFASLSTSATFVAGSNRNGWTTWRNSEGKSLAEVFKR